MNSANHIAAVASEFQIPGDFLVATHYGSGHINDTWCVVSNVNGGSNRTILQRINKKIFTNPDALMENIQRVTSHLARKVSQESDSDRRVLTLIPARNGRAWHRDAAGENWRAYRFIDRAHSYDAVQTVAQAFQAARAFGRFQELLSDLPAPPLHQIIRDFHNTPLRFAALQQAIASDSAGRANSAKSEIDFAFANQSVANILVDANLPQRVTHNDTKFNNVLIDDEKGEGICVIDLDTVMPGSVLFDFGDMVRTTTSPAAEDELDLSKVYMQFPMFEALVRGYLCSAGRFLTNAEKSHLATAGKVITYEQGIRFLADYLSGDMYYKVHHYSHNLDRCRTQFKLLESIIQQEKRMEQLVNSIPL